MKLKELALRRWTVEFADKEKTNPVLLIGNKDLPRGSIQMYQIKRIDSTPPWWFEIEVLDHTPEGRLSGGVSRFTTRNVEEWPNLDVEVFKHFEVDPKLYPEDIEYKSWLVQPLVCESTFNREQTNFGQQCETLHPPEPLLYSNQAKEKMFVMIHPGTPWDVTEWINKHGLAERVVSIVATSLGNFNIFYRNDVEVK